MTQQRMVLASAAVLSCALLLAACGSSGGDASGARPGRAAQVAPTPSKPAPPAPAARGNSGNGRTAVTSMLKAKAMHGTGSVVTDDRGMTLYRYDKDQANPSKWTCAGECTKTWMPVIVQDSVQTKGVEKSLLGTVHRNGTKQLTLAGWPLYRYAGDAKAGQMNGQGRDNEWYAVSPSGQKSAPTN